MSDETKNRTSESSEDADLRQLFLRGTPTFAPVEIDNLLRKSLAGEHLVANAEKSAKSTPQLENSPMPAASSLSKRWEKTVVISRLLALGAVAASIGAAIVLGISGGNSVLAKVQTALKDVQTATYSITQSIGDQPAETLHVKLNGRRAYRVDWPNGNYIIFDVPGKRMMEVNPAKSVAAIRENIPIPENFDLLAKLANLKESAIEVGSKVPDREIGGKVVPGFVVDDNGVRYMVWADPNTHLPFEMELVHSARPQVGQNGPFAPRTKERWKDFQFGQPLDENLFTFKVPDGFAVETLPRPPVGTIQEIRERTRKAVEASEGMKAAKNNSK
jgi:outer membrane lipoprotein-sorting protein